MDTIVKPVEFLTIDDLEKYSVWKFVNDDLKGETLVKSVKRTPVKSLTGKVIGLKVTLADNSKAWAIIGNVDVNNPVLTKHFLSISLYNNLKWFHLSRYHDFDYKKNGPVALGKFLLKAVDQIFPISYDLRPYSGGDEKALVGKILKEPEVKLSRVEIIALAVP
jgi:hypothetical protein